MIKKVGEIIMQRREEVGMTKAQFARRLGCSHQNIDSLERRKSIDFELAEKICLILEFDLFENFRTFGKSGSKVESRLKTELDATNRKYIDLLEKYNFLLEKSVKDEIING